MIEVLHRSAMGRLTTWDSGRGTVRTPAIAFVHTRSRPAPRFAELRVAGEAAPDAGVTFTLGGSYFVPRPGAGGIPVPPTSGLPLHAAEVEIPTAAADGQVASILRPSDARGRPSEVLIADHGPEFLANPRRFVRFLVDLREAAGPIPLVWVPGVASPSILAVLAYCGVDLVDSARVRWDGVRSGFHTSDGLLPAAARDRDVCRCDGCASEDVVLHNESALDGELRVVRQAIRHGTLRELAERRAVNDPWSVAVLRHLDLREQAFQEPFFPVTGGPVRVYAPGAFTRPDVVRFQHRVLHRVVKPPSARVAVLLPCSARKPYAASPSHRRFREAIRRSGRAAAVHELVVTSPFGLVPRELEVVHPVRSYDVPVTGDWSRDEGHVLSELVRRFLERNRYEAVIAHLGPEAPFVAEAAPEATFCATARLTAPASLEALSRAVSAATEGVEAPPWSARRLEDLAGLAAYQFGPAGQALLEGASLRGRPEGVRILRAGEQLGAVTSRGQISLTLAGARAIASQKAYLVEIEDFHPKGNVFAVGVTAATPDIRIGDEVAVVHAGEVRAVGVARMAWREMVEAERGEAVRVRHRAVPEKG